MKFDVIIVSKDRYPLLFRQIKRIKTNFPYNKIIVVDSNERIPNVIQRLYHEENIEYYHTPNAKLGYARQKGLGAVSTPFFFMVDDDIVFYKGLAEKLYSEMLKYGPTVFAMSPVIIFGTNKDIISVYTRKKKDSEGVSSGCCMLFTQTAINIGGFNTKIHIGEDAELFNRARTKNYRWIRKHGLFVRHPGNNVEFIFRPWRQREGKMTAIAYGLDNYHGVIIKRMKSIFSHCLSLIRYRNINSVMFFICQDVIHILAFIRGIIGGKTYALHKTKIV